MTSASVTVAMLGARCHYAVPRLLHEAGCLEAFHTDSYIGNKPVLRALIRALPPGLAGRGISRWLGREDPALPPAKVLSQEYLGLWYALARRRARGTAAQHRLSAEVARRFNATILRRMGRPSGPVWGFNTAALELLAAARTAGMPCILEQTMLPYRLTASLLAREAADWPGWQPGFSPAGDGGLPAEREEAEWRLADRIVAGSGFVRDGLIDCGVAPEKIAVIPYGVDVSRFPAPAGQESLQPSRPLRVLFVGEVGLRKGAPYLLEALRMLGPAQVEAQFCGHVALDPARLAPYASVARFSGTVPRRDMAGKFAWADVFVLPSIVEGSAVSSYEALLSGLPVVVTPNVGAIIAGDDAGQIVPVRDAPVIARALSRYRDEPDLLAQHRAGALALRDAASTERYGRDLVALVRGI